MTDKAYIVANKQQEREVLEKLEREGMLWRGSGYKPTEKSHLIKDPITLFAKDDNQLTYDYEVTESYLSNFEIVYDGRKEGKMDKKYKVTQKFMDELNIWRDKWGGDNGYVDGFLIDILPGVVESWRFKDNSIERNNRLIAIIKWLNGEDVFEVDKPHKFVVRSEMPNADGDYVYVLAEYAVTNTVYSLNDATKFNTELEAQEWANAHQVVVEIDEDGNEVD